MKRKNYLSEMSTCDGQQLLLELQQQPESLISKNKVRRPSSWCFLALAIVLGIFLLSSAPTCQGSSLLVRREISRAEPYRLVQNWDEDETSWPSHGHSRKKRDAATTVVTASPAISSPANAGENSKSSKINSKIKSSAVPLNDSHNQLLVFWAGEDVILCLAKNAEPSNNNSGSVLWISRDYGRNFTNATSLLVQNQTGGSTVSSMPVLEGFYNHPSHNGHFAFTDIINKVIYTTRNYGAEFTANKVEFAPDEVLFDPHSDRNIVAYEKTTKNKQMWVSIDFGKTWVKVQDHVKTLSWDESVMPAALYLQREEPSSESSPGGVEGRSVILKSNSLFLEAKDTEVIVSGVEEFEIKDDFLFATKPKPNGTYDLLISYRKSPFKTAMFPSNEKTRHFFIADVSTDGQIFVCVVHNESVSNLFIGSFPEDEEDPKFTLSLERILYFKPNVTWSESWLNEVASEPFVDLHPIDGLRGVYIASQLKPSTVTSGKFNMNEVISLITFDQGAEWKVLNPPEFEHDGRPIYCQYSGSGNCSLHISQRLSELYPRTRAVPILSKKSAVGMVMATGTVNTTLKGHLGVYLSTDGASSWRQVLQGNYLYSFGDHGGIIVATKMYKMGDDTNELLYSIDEGETWETYEFYEEKVRIMGLMTEPGENTTTFFIFGSIAPPKPDAASTSSSGNSKHTWVLIKVDFRDVFDRDCTPEDYKMWSPLDGEDGNMRRHCLLGRKESYERRIPTHRCYNGKNFVRRIANETCPCKRIDFECDFGYVLDTRRDMNRRETWECIKDNSESSVGVKAEWCRPSDLGLPEYYNKTKGYRKIPGDTCMEGGWISQYLPEQIPCEVKEEPEFMLVAKRDSVMRIDLNHYERVETLPLSRVKAVIAVDFNLKNNCIFWSDVTHKTIMKLHLDGKSTAEILVSTDITSVEGIAFDWIANNLYFADGGGGKIEVVRVDNRKMRRRLLTKPVVQKPRGIAVHPEKGYFFWTDWFKDNPGIWRAHLDGTHVEKIVGNKPGPAGRPIPDSEMVVKWPNGITVDYLRDRLFWVEANLDRIMTSDLNGGNVQIVIQQNSKVSHPFAVGVYKSSIYWDDWTTRAIYNVPLDHIDKNNFTASNQSVFKIKGDLPRLMDLKIYGTGAQSGDNLCGSQEKSNCSQLCFASPNMTAVSCVCPDGFNMLNGSCVCPDGKPPHNVNGSHICESKCDDHNTFHCRTHPQYCIINAWRCDGENDCGDMSDEEDCSTQVCADPLEFKCRKSGRCIPNSFRCDYDDDCGAGDHSDEENCNSTRDACDLQKNFLCANGRCILKSWRCDEDDDCLDGSDEKDCEDFAKNGTFVCANSEEWKCPNENRCISPDWLCDFDQDCTDGSDEFNCTARPCPEWKFSCNTSGHCIMKTWECDGDKDCPNGDDEHDNCPPPSTPTPENPFAVGNCSQMSQMFQCLGSPNCIPIFWVCDHVKDCQDGSDELGCSDGETTEMPHTVTVAPDPSRCTRDQWRCSDGACIAMYALCDGIADCKDGQDERNCHNATFAGCPAGMRKCGSSRACIPLGKWCDGKADCPNKVDENDCSSVLPWTCNSGELKCDEDCKPLFKQCDGKQDCDDGTDEKHDVCTASYERVHQVEGIDILEVDSEWVEFEWWLPSNPSGKKLQFIPEFCELESGECRNASDPITARNYKFTGLHPFKKYSITVYVVDPTSGKKFPPYLYSNVTTEEEESSAPLAVHVSQNTTEDLIISWKRPHSPNGKLKGYKVYFQPPVPPAEVDADKETLIISNKQSDPVFLPGENYTFWVTAVNGKGEGKASQLVSYVYSGEVAFMSELNVKGFTDNSARFSWTPSNSHVDTYSLILQTDVPGSLYTFRNKTETTEKLIEFKHLSPGTRYKLTVIPKYKGLHGPHRTVSFNTKGSPLPTIGSFSVTAANNGHAKVTWRPVKLTGDFMYGIYYGKNVHEMSERRARIVTEQTQVEVMDLEACENYLFDIGLVNGPTGGIGPLTERPQTLHTKMNPKSPPKYVQVERAPFVEDGIARIKVTWRAPCDVMDKPVGYNITIVETTFDRTYAVFNISFDQSPELSHILKINYGGHYQLTVTTSVDGGKPSVPVYFDGPAIPFPEKVEQCTQCNGLTIFWNHPTLPRLVTRKGKESFVVWLSKDPEFKNAKRYDTQDSSFRFDDATDSGIYYAAVSVKDAEGLESPKSSPIMIQHVDEAAPVVVLPGSSAMAISITVVVVLVVLISVLAVFVVRHKRLQTSFLNFASSHYSSSSGAATFQQTMEDQDSPVIRGFSDDEPLLVA